MTVPEWLDLILKYAPGVAALITLLWWLQNNIAAPILALLDTARSSAHRLNELEKTMSAAIEQNAVQHKDNTIRAENLMTRLNQVESLVSGIGYRVGMLEDRRRQQGGTS